MRVTPAFSPSLLHRFSRRTPLLAAAVCVALAVSGCASRTPLGEKLDDAKHESAPVAADGAQTTTITQFQKFMWFFSPYRPDIQQGNFVSEEMLAQLKVGMTRDQVRFIFGTALAADIFHADRWDYPFRLAKGDGEITTSRVTVFFKDGKVDHWEGGHLPTEKEYIDRIAGPVKSKDVAAAKPPQSSVTPAGTAPATAPAPAPTASAAAQPAAQQ